MWPIKAEVYPQAGTLTMKQLGIFLPPHPPTPPPPPPPQMESVAGLSPSIKIAGTHLVAWVRSGNVRAKCLVPRT